MSTIKLQVKELQEQISLSANAQKNETIINANSNILKRLNASLIKLERAKTKFNTMPLISSLDSQLIPHREGDESNGYLISEDKEFILGNDIESLLEGSKDSMCTFSEKWNDMNYKAQQDESLNNSIHSLESFTKIISSLNNIYWEKWVINLENDFVVEDVVLEQQTSLGKKEVYKDYNKLKATFDVEKLSKAVNSGLVSSLNYMKEELIKLRDQMDKSELPEDVVKFLKELDAPWSTPTLELVTPAVFEWLSKQGLLQKLKISR
ncbi:hypothetical protein CMT41_07480 [Colwellia sp. MT41]|uniref:hypothetical protein n=1 Tax=Colwellia sp. MT41 TaxID=58049 RepID=UPI000717B3D8|nr:hypothetical protein [Colwellia sp. MT41]ALO34573.1 hypothetical protein CMT41_07480 [Colwellia sp. MT41]